MTPDEPEFGSKAWSDSVRVGWAQFVANAKVWDADREKLRIMTQHPRPRTTEEFMALPIGPEFGIDHRMIDGVLRRCPVMMPIVAVYHGPEDIVSCGPWVIGRYADGRWFRSRLGG